MSALAGLGGVLLGRLREPAGDAASQLFPGVLAPVAAATTSFTDGTLDVTVISGYASNDSGSGIGVYGQSDASSGTAVHGAATNASGTNYGVLGESDSISGRGVRGNATNLSGFTYGVYGLSSSIAGRGVYGLAANSSGTTYGVYGETWSIFGRGVLGYAINDSGFTYGVVGQSNSVQGVGVRGLAGKFGTIPIIAQGASGQTASLQEWRNNVGAFGEPLAVVDANGQLGVGTSTPQFKINVVGTVDPTGYHSILTGSLLRTLLGDGQEEPRSHRPQLRPTTRCWF